MTSTGADRRQEHIDPGRKKVSHIPGFSQLVCSASIHRPSISNYPISVHEHTHTKCAIIQLRLEYWSKWLLSGSSSLAPARACKRRSGASATISTGGGRVAGCTHTQSFGIVSLFLSMPTIDGMCKFKSSLSTTTNGKACAVGAAALSKHSLF